MEDNFAIQLFEGNKVRIVWDEEQEKYYFSVVDIVQVLTDSTDGRKYWNKLKQRLKEEGNESVTNCHQLKLEAADGKKYKTDVADFEQLFRLIQSIPSLLTICHQLTNGRNYLKILIYNIEEPSPCYI
jgi:hypothetical protein